MKLPSPINAPNAKATNTKAKNLIEELEETDDTFLIEDGESLSLQECSGDKLSNTEIIVEKALFGIFLHHKNGRIFHYTGEIKNIENGKFEEISPDKYLEWAEKGNMIANSSNLRNLLNLEQAKELISFYTNNDLI